MALFCFLFFCKSVAFGFEVDGVYYGVSSEDERTCYVTYKYISYGKITNDYKGDVVIPASVTDSKGVTYSVTAIGEKAFYNSKEITSLTIPGSVKTIKKNAFVYAFKENSDIVINISSVKDWMDIDFEEANANPLMANTNYIPANHVYLAVKGKKLEDVVVPSSVTKVKPFIFYHYTDLKSVTFHDDIEEVGGSAFECCKSLAEVELPKSLKKIGQRAFYGLDGLGKVFISDLATYCNLEIEGLGSPLSSAAAIYVNGVLTEDFEIPEGISEINPNAFSRSAIVRLKLPNSVRKIPGSAFEGCKQLEEVILPDELDELGYSAFRDCSSLKHLVMPKKMPSYNKYTDCFSGCVGLGQIRVLTTLSSGGIVKVSDLGTIENGNFAVEGYVDAKKTSVFGRLDLQTGYGIFNNLGKDVDYYARIGFRSGSYYFVITAGGYMSIPKETAVKPTRATASSMSVPVEHVFYTSRNDTLRGIINLPHEGKDSLFLSGLDPDTKYEYDYTVNVGFYPLTGKVGFKTQPLTMATHPGQAMNTNTALLCAETNLSDEEDNVGFEWRRYDAPATLPSNKAASALCDGVLQGALGNLNPDYYYNYRPYYTANSGMTYYGEWITFYTADAYVYFDPMVRTYSPKVLSETSVELKGYALRGSDEIARQGFQLWKAWATKAPAKAPERDSDIITVEVKGQRLSYTFDDLKPGTRYFYRTFVQTESGMTYGDEQTFTTPGSAGNGIQNVEPGDADAHEIARYNLQGVRVHAPQKGINIIHYSDGTKKKVLSR